MIEMRIRNLFERLMQTQDAKQIKHKLAEGQGTETADGQVWSEAWRLYEILMCSSADAPVAGSVVAGEVPIEAADVLKNMQVRWVVRQKVQTVSRSWMEDISSSPYERVARMEYEGYVKEHPDAYFELLAVVSAEICRDFTKTVDA